MKRILAALILLMLATPSWAGFDEGLAAAKRRDYATALREFRPLAEQGDAFAQHNLGFMYYNGWAVPRNYVQAHKWWDLAAANGLKDAAYNRDFVETKMTPAQIAEAKKLVREWLEAFHKRVQK